MRERCISRNWRETTALPPLVHIEAARTTWLRQLGVGGGTGEQLSLLQSHTMVSRRQWGLLGYTVLFRVS
jgi:hypothetical protein